VSWVHTASAGVDHVLFPELVSRGTIVTNSAGIFERSIAEYVLGLILLHAKGFRVTLAAQEEHRWAYRESADIVDKHLLVVGLGRVGRAVASLAVAVGMHVEGVRRSPGPDPLVAAVHPVSRLADAVRDADYVAVTVARTPQTRHLLDAAILSSIKPGAYLINVSRGDILDTDALGLALRSGQLAGAALDVFESEPLLPSDPLWDTPNLLVSPHMAGDSAGWAERVVDTFAENGRRFRAGLPLLNSVDPGRGY
jgi:phosphoglycerate dehydrogenase-like enzyme